MLLGYAHVSKSDDKETAPQTRPLKQVGCKKVFGEPSSDQTGRRALPKVSISRFDKPHGEQGKMLARPKRQRPKGRGNRGSRPEMRGFIPQYRRSMRPVKPSRIPRMQAASWRR